MFGNWQNNNGFDNSVGLKSFDKNYLVKRAKMIRAAGHPTRLKILFLISIEKEVSAGSIIEGLDMTRQNYAFHMQYLKQSGLITTRKKGSYMLYSLTQDGELLLSVL